MRLPLRSNPDKGKERFTFKLTFVKAKKPPVYCVAYTKEEAINRMAACMEIDKNQFASVTKKPSDMPSLAIPIGGKAGYSILKDMYRKLRPMFINKQSKHK